MKVFIFLGPTLPISEAREIVDAVYLPPAAQGDVCRAVSEKPFAIGIIDGYFEQVPAVWHKEILWAIAQGVHVFGGGSMGALRAAELDWYGMVGVGTIYEAFRAGVLEDDDEVAVAHSDGRSGYRATSEAMVNLRATFHRAEVAGVLSSPLRAQLERIAKATFYPERSLAGVFRQARLEGIEEVAGLRERLELARVDQKREDAIQMLTQLRECRESGNPPRAARFRLAHTDAWDSVVSWAAEQPLLTRHSEGICPTAIAAEVRLEGAEGRAMIASAWSRVVAGLFTRRNGGRLSSPQRCAATSAFREANGLLSDAALEQWLNANDLDMVGLDALIEGDTQLDDVRSRWSFEFHRCLLAELRSNGSYPRFLARAVEKEERLRESGVQESISELARDEAQALRQWYIQERLGLCPLTEAGYRALGWIDGEGLDRDAHRERTYTRLSSRGS